MSARNMVIMNAHLIALDQEQETIAQFMSTQPHSGNIHMQNYRKAAAEINVKKQNELQALVSQNVENLRTQLLLVIGQKQEYLKSELTQNITSLKLEISTMKTAYDEKMKLLKDSQEDLKNDVAFVRHELKSVGEKLTTINHMITNRNKELLARIEALEKDVLLLKTPPKKSEFQWFEFILCVLLVVVPLVGFFLKRSETGLMMIGY
jgi:chromosome segregation ATPase